MQVVGFNFSKIHAEKLIDKINSKPSTSIEFTNLEKEKVEILKDTNTVKITFEYSIAYENPEKKKDTQEGKLILKGIIILSVNEEELHDITKSWKKKKLPGTMNLFLFNFLLRKCTPKAIFLEDELNLPIHTPMPRLTPQPSPPQ